MSVHQGSFNNKYEGYSLTSLPQVNKAHSLLLGRSHHYFITNIRISRFSCRSCRSKKLNLNTRLLCLSAIQSNASSGHRPPQKPNRVYFTSWSKKKRYLPSQKRINFPGEPWNSDTPNRNRVVQEIFALTLKDRLRCEVTKSQPWFDLPTSPEPDPDLLTLPTPFPRRRTQSYVTCPVEAGFERCYLDIPISACQRTPSVPPAWSERFPPYSVNVATLTISPPGMGAAFDALSMQQSLGQRRPASATLPSFELPNPQAQQSSQPKHPLHSSSGSVFQVHPSSSSASSARGARKCQSLILSILNSRYHKFTRPYPSYSLPAMNGPVMSNIHSPNNQMALIGSMQPNLLPGFSSGHAASLHHVYSGHPHPHAHHFNSLVPPPQNDRPFRCDLCPQSFNRNHDLKRHKRIHLAVKPFPCHHCDKSFSRKDALKRHILVKGCGKDPASDTSTSSSTTRSTSASVVGTAVKK
ncbi:hypothetical protein CIHG_06249 [Coccidioides immitis H538.4]|uniref:C2H2-type domain-containing protein n=2 Tax=Coccidioides immitis TaxID=5501 RepID=A0A0J8RWF7_COCIT|nr:hypothetical protein CIHG_06249 [Coccidioides immitis H538.4]